jgi:HAE1 family hydrophobic/amphiphilic exporter-1
MLVLAFVALGAISLAQLPAELNPQVDFGTVTINTTFTGTNPAEMETLITKPIEDSIAGVSGLKQISSISQLGVSIITCQFYIGTDMDTAEADVREKVDAVTALLPTGATAPSVSKRDTSAQPVMYIAMSGGQSSVQLRTLADNVITPLLEQAPDVAAITAFGGDQRQITVSTSRDRLNAYQITISQLATAIQNATNNVSAGYIQTSNAYQNIQFLGEFASVDEIKNLRLSFPNTTGTGSRSVQLSDIATVKDTVVERTQSSTIDGKDTVTITVEKTSDGNTLKACNGIRQQLLLVQTQIPKDIHFTVTTDQSKNVHDNLNDVMVSLFLGAFLAIVIVYLFLHNFRATVIIAIAIPTCVIATFLPINALGFTLNTMTLLGLSLAIGVLIDDSIVVLENITRHLRMGEDPVTAAINGRTEIGLAALTLTAVDLVVFLPIAFMGGVIGEFFRSFGSSISIAVLCSLFVSFTLTPMLASRWFVKGESLESDGQGRRGFFAAFDRGYVKFEHNYQRFLGAILKGVWGPWIVVVSGNLLLIVALILIFPRLGFRFAPGQDQNQVAVQIQCPAGSSLDYTTKITKEVERRIRADSSLNQSVQYLSTSVGRSQAAGNAYTGTQYASINVSLYDKAAPLDLLIAPFVHGGPPLRKETDVAVGLEIRKLVKNIPGAIIQASEVSGFGGGGAPLQINITGSNFNDLLNSANLIKDLVSKWPGVYNTDLSFKASQPEVDIRLDRSRAADYGLTLQTISQAVSDAMEGNNNAKFRDPVDSEQYDILVQLDDADRNNVYNIGQIQVGFQNGNPITLSQVASISLGSGPTRVERLNRQRQISVTGYLLPGTQIGNVKYAVDPKILAMQRAGKLGTNTYSWGGEAQSIGDEGGYLITALLLGIGLSYMLMAALFNNMVHPLTVMLTLPQALIGALTSLLCFGQPFSLIAAIGVIMLNGLAAKNAILLVDYTNTLRSRGYKRVDALLAAAPTRLRPILMTSIAIIGATAPTAFALGRGAGFRQPLGIVVVGGVVVSTVLTLVVIPCVYVLFDSFYEWCGRNRRISVPDVTVVDRPAEPTRSKEDLSGVGR